MDESGKSGTMRLENGSWNLNGAPYFVMAAVIVPDEKVPLLEAKVDSILREFHIQGGELKSLYRQVDKYRQEIIDIFGEFLREVNGKVLSEASSKKYNICMTITEYCALPYYDTPDSQAFSQEETMIKMMFANFFAERLSDNLLAETVTFFDSSSHDAEGLVNLCGKIIASSDDGSIASGQVIRCIEGTIGSIKQHTRLGLSVENLFPVPDSYSGGRTSTVISPQINCINNLLFRAGNEGEYTCKLDKMYDLADSISANAELHGKLFGRKLSVGFFDSKSEKGIQAADFLAGSIRQYVESAQGLANVSPIKLPSAITDGINIIGTFREQARVHPLNIELQMMTELYDDWRAAKS
ncbi:MAG: DUF3800 domain-containing protein [Synergistaceae bacterium]|nr:DUF3800 domain-containing protein [Synergistaceae bacterium]